MARMVKCNATGVVGDSSTFYKVNNKWYQSEDVYQKCISEKEYQNKFIEKIFELMGYSDKNVFPAIGLLMKRIKDSKLSKEELYKSLLEREEYIKELFGEITEHHSDNGRVLGIFKIIETIPKSITYGGCYEIKNLDTSEVYIGETLDFFTRMNTHISDLYANKHHCKALQEAFNECHDISHFKITPLYLYEIKGKDKEVEKHNTLYLECAYFLKYKKEKKTLYNTVNPYIALKENSVFLENYTVDCKKVLELLLEDKQNILPEKVRDKVEKDLK